MQQKIKYLLTTFLVLNLLVNYAQNLTPVTLTDNLTNIENEEKALFPGGNKECQKFIAANLKTPSNFYADGKVVLRFNIDKNGEIDSSSIALVNGLSSCKECNTEAIKVVKKIPRWQPAKKNGIPVRSQIDLHVMFKL